MRMYVGWRGGHLGGPKESHEAHIPKVVQAPLERLPSAETKCWALGSLHTTPRNIARVAKSLRPKPYLGSDV